MNEIDLIALVVLGLFLWRGYKEGFWAYTTRLVSLILGLIGALYVYAPLGTYLATQFTLTPRIGAVIAFVLALLLIQMLVDFALERAWRRYPGTFRESLGTRRLALVPAAFDAIFVIVLLIVASAALPLPTSVGTKVSASATGELAARLIPEVQAALDRATGGRLSSALSELTTYPGESGEGRTLPFKPSRTSVDELAEAQMLVLVNEERAKVGAPPLVIDEALIRSARLHSEDMWERQYFAHENPDGKSPFDRMLAADAVFLLAGENLALAPTTQLAHVGLMNSPGHRRNILDPNFRRVGIGIIDGGIYGKMVTQNFAN